MKLINALPTIVSLCLATVIESLAADTEVTIPLQLEKHYLNLPVKNGAPMRHLSLLVDGKVVHERPPIRRAVGEFDVKFAGNLAVN